MKKILLAVLSALLLGSTFVCTNALADVPDNRINYSSEYNANVSAGVATVKKNVAIDNTKAAQITPVPDCGVDSAVSLDSWMLQDNNFDLNIYNYAIVRYKYVVSENEPSYTGKMKMRLLGTGTKAVTKTVEIQSLENVVTNQWATVTFCIGSATEPFLNPELDVHHLKQMHFKPYGETPVADLTVNDVMYIESVTLTAKNPNPDYEYEHTFASGEVRASGSMPAVKCKAEQTLTLPESTFVFADADFDGWVWSYDDKTYSAGDVLTMPEGSTSFKAKWKYKVEQKQSVSLSYQTYYMKDSGATKGAIVEKVTEDGVKAVKARIDPERAEEQAIYKMSIPFSRYDLNLLVYSSLGTCVVIIRFPLRIML